MSFAPYPTFVMRIIITAILLIVLQQFNHSQNTVGLLSYDPDLSFDGYNLFFPHVQSDVFLINNCGELVHTWEGDPETRPGNSAYLLEDGRLVKTYRKINASQGPLWAGGGGESIEIRDWDNNLQWRYEPSDSTKRLHHDVAIINKNNKMTIAMIAWELKTYDEAILAGRNPNNLAGNQLWPDHIIEIDPLTNDIVWEWHAWDHLIQDFDSTKNNFGVIAEHPELININLDENQGQADWMHTNSIDYSADNDLILLSIPHFNEIWVIDHSTTTAEAASHIGGNTGKGGDLLYRWGKEKNYNQDTISEQKLFFNHDANWIDDYISKDDSNFGKISVFNNRVNNFYSTVNIIDPQFDSNTNTFPYNGNSFAPENFDLTVTHPVDENLLWSTGLSSVQYLPNKNLLICAGRPGYFFEITPNNEIVWEYKNPMEGGQPVDQGTNLETNQNINFKLHRIPSKFPAFTNKNLEPKGWIETNPNTLFCDSLTALNFIENVNIQISPNPATNHLNINKNSDSPLNIEVWNGLGQAVKRTSLITSNSKIDISHLPTGIYFIRFENKQSFKFIINR